MDARPIYCPVCQSPDVRIVATLSALHVCACMKCSAEFTIGMPKPAELTEDDL
jgi:ribosomal protein L37AE/L43A